MELFRTLAAAYLIATLSATSLAKLRNWRVASVGILRERVIPYRAATAVIILVAFAEFLLATILMLRVEPEMTGFATAGLFLAFGGYRLVVAAKTKSLNCICAGTTRSDPASVAAVTGTVVACLLQAALACTLAMLSGHPSGNLLEILPIIAWAAPFCIFLAKPLLQSGEPKTDDRFPVEFASLDPEFRTTSSGPARTLDARPANGADHEDAWIETV
jgi:hypothetical protein